MMTRRQGAFSAIRVVRGQHAFVTGATGFVGGHVARALSSEGWHVKALVRDGGPMSSSGVSKREAEAAVEREWTGPWIVLRPAVVYGPGDRGLLPLFRAAARGWVPVPAGRSRIQVIHAEQAALAIARAAGRS